jgi:hypothetical protein
MLPKIDYAIIRSVAMARLEQLPKNGNGTPVNGTPVPDLENNSEEAVSGTEEDIPF